MDSKELVAIKWAKNLEKEDLFTQDLLNESKIM